MSEATGLSEEHARWLEDRGIPCELAAAMGLTSRGRSLGFPYVGSGGKPLFVKWRGPDKRFWIEPAGQKLEPWLLPQASAASSDTLIWTEGEIDALSVLAAGAGPVVSAPNGAPSKPGEGDIVPATDSAFAYLWGSDGKLRPEIEHAWGVTETETGYTGRALRQIRAMARKYQLLIVIVTHPSKSGGQKPDPESMTLYDIAGSAHWANKPDHGVLIWRPSGSDETIVKVAKCRDYRKRGQPGTVRMRFDPRSATFAFAGSG